VFTLFNPENILAVHTGVTIPVLFRAYSCPWTDWFKNWLFNKEMSQKF
jgi:hypothetical protein